ncbi:hypothetical protein PMIN06_001413 [Paraphaeosphaeria minitans]
MFSRAVPRVAPRAAGLVQCEASQVAARVPSWAMRCPQHPLSRRYRSTFREQFGEQFRRSPISFPFALVSIFALAGWGAYYIPWYYHNVIQKPYHNFPEPVANKLRRAIFYSRGQHLDVREANKYFRQALQLATKMGMDPFSDEIMGVKYAIAALFEEQGYHAMACDVLEIMRTDTQRWIDEFSDKHISDGNRSRVKKNMVQINLKLGQLYGCPYVNEPQDAEKRLVEAVEGALGELQRREAEGIKQGEGLWMTNDELGATLEGTLLRALTVYLTRPALRTQRLALPRLTALSARARTLSTHVMSQRRANEQHLHMSRSADTATRFSDFLFALVLPEHTSASTNRTRGPSTPMGRQSASTSGLDYRSG